MFLLFAGETQSIPTTGKSIDKANLTKKMSYKNYFLSVSFHMYIVIIKFKNLIFSMALKQIDIRWIRIDPQAN